MGHLIRVRVSYKTGTRASYKVREKMSQIEVQTVQKAGE